MRRGYVNIGSDEAPVLIHYRQQGQGPVLLMLHASPVSSHALLPFIRVLSPYVTVIAPDTPGYGYSDQLQGAGLKISDYAAALDQFCQGLGLVNAGVYGSATGAQIAIEFSKRFEQRVDYLILDNAADFNDEERKRITAGYFPDLAPDALAGHLIKIWAIARDLGVFFPWHERSKEARLPASMINADAVHTTAMGYLQAGKDYDRAYRAAFANERAAELLPVKVPVTIIRWEGSILKPYTDRFDKVPWADNVCMAYCGPTLAERIDTLTETVKKYIKNSRSVAAAKAIGHAGQYTMRRFIDLDSDQVHTCQAGMSNQHGLLLLHNLTESCRALAEILSSLSDHFHVIAPDLPGHGASEIEANDLQAVVLILAQLIRKTQISDVAVLAVGDSAAVAVALGLQYPDLIARLYLLNPVDYTKQHEGQDGWVAPLFPLDFTVADDGSHLLKTWYMLRDSQLFWPWYEHNPSHALGGQPELDADDLTARLVDYWQLQPGVKKLSEIIRNYPLQSVMNELVPPLSLLTIKDSPRGGPSRINFAGHGFIELSQQPDQWAQELMQDEPFSEIMQACL